MLTHAHRIHGDRGFSWQDALEKYNQREPEVRICIQTSVYIHVRTWCVTHHAHACTCVCVLCNIARRDQGQPAKQAMFACFLGTQWRYRKGTMASAFIVFVFISPMSSMQRICICTCKVAENVQHPSYPFRVMYVTYALGCTLTRA